MSKKTEDTQDIHKSIDELEKSWEDAKSNVLALLGEAPATALEKSDDNDADDEDEDEDGEESDKEEKVSKADGDMEYNEEEDDEDEEDGKEEKVSKSIEDELEKSGDDVALAMDAEPFLRELVGKVDKRFASVEKAISGIAVAIKNTQELQKATAKMLSAYGDLTKATADTVEKIGNTPMRSSSVINGRTERFEKSQSDDELEMNKSQILDKSLKLVQAGKMQGRMLTKIEGRLNKGMSLDDEMIAALKQTIKKEEV